VYNLKVIEILDYYKYIIRLRNGPNITVIRVENGFEGCGEIFDHQIFN
jgi:hypothetical protein